MDPEQRAKTLWSRCSSSRSNATCSTWIIRTTCGCVPSFPRRSTPRLIERLRGGIEARSANNFFDAMERESLPMGGTEPVAGDALPLPRSRHRRVSAGSAREDHASSSTHGRIGRVLVLLGPRHVACFSLPRFRFAAPSSPKFVEAAPRRPGRRSDPCAYRGGGGGRQAER